MDTPELLIISGYPALIDDIRLVCRQIGITPRLMEWERANQELLDGLTTSFAAEGRPDVIISRGAVADLVERAFTEIVVLRAEPDDVDLLEALAEAGKAGRRVGFLIYGPRAADFKTESVRRLLGLEVLRLYPVNSKLDIERTILQGQQDGMEVMVGGGKLGKRTGEALNIPVIFAETSRRSIRTAVEQALAIIESRRSEKRQLQSLKAVVASVQEGIMTLRGRTITLVNGVLASMLRLPGGGFTSRDADAMRRKPPELDDLDPTLRQFLQQDENAEAILSIRNQTLFCRKLPLSERSEPENLMLICRNVTDIQRQERKVRKELHTKGFTARFEFTDIIGASSALGDTLEKARMFATTDANLLIHGPSGTGKELFAQSVHNASPRRNRPFVAVNCAAIPETLLESELFGYEEGAFSGAARNGKIGLFELAHEGTIFLDEIDSLSMGLQAVLLRVIQEKQVRRVGSRSIVSIDTRILSATNRSLAQLGQVFRADLYHRLNTLNLRLPPLSERQDDALLLAEHFLNVYAARYATVPPTLGTEDRAFILGYHWPGNVRELENLMHRHVVLGTSGHRRAVRDSLDCWTETEGQTDGSPATSTTKRGETPEDVLLLPKGSLAEMEQTIILRTLEEERWNKNSAADRLGICRTTLWRKLKEYKGSALL